MPSAVKRLRMRETCRSTVRASAAIANRNRFSGTPRTRDTGLSIIKEEVPYDANVAGLALRRVHSSPFCMALKAALQPALFGLMRWIH